MSENSKVILTTRRPLPLLRASAVRLTGLVSEEAINLLRGQATSIGLPAIERESESRLQELVEVTGGNPQAMKLALGLIKGGTVDFSEIVDQLRGSYPSENIDPIFEELFSWSFNLLSASARQIMLTTPLFVGASSIREEALQATAELNYFEFHQGLSECTSFGLLDAHNINRFGIHSITRAFAKKKLDDKPEFKGEARDRVNKFFLKLVRESVTRPKPEPRYWNSLVSDGMAVLDSDWPSIQGVMDWAVSNRHNELLIEFVMLLVHYMDSRYLNSERLLYVTTAVSALAEMGRKEDEALLRIDALGWTYVEENKLDDAYTEITKGFHI